MSRNGRPLSMVDAVEIVGVSYQTVSCVVNDKGRVPPRTHERVQAAVEQLGYRPNSVARVLVTARSGIIGAVTTISAHFGPSSMLVVLEVAACEAGLFTSVVALNCLGPDGVANVFNHSSSLAVEAIVVIAPVDSLAKTVASQGMFVSVVVASGRHTFGHGVSVVHADQCGSARALVEHPMTLGHCDITCVADPQEWFEAREHVTRWREMMVQAGPPMYEPLAGSWEACWGYAAGQNIIEDDLPDVVMRANGEAAVGLLRAFVEVGVSVPGDAPIASFNDMPMAVYAGPGPITMRQDLADLGRCVLEAVSYTPDGGPVGTYVRPTRFVVRGSMGVCPHQRLFSIFLPALCVGEY